jgi:hypothetical protein
VNSQSQRLPAVFIGERFENLVYLRCETHQNDFGQPTDISRLKLLCANYHRDRFAVDCTQKLYISFGEMAGVIPQGSMQKFIDEHGYEKGVKACKKNYEAERVRLKAITLGVLYGKTVFTVASECGITTREAGVLLHTHKRNFPKFWRWISWMVNETLATHKITTKLGWQRWILPKKERDARKDDENRNKKIQNSLQNFQMQAHGAEMLRLACIYAAEKGLAICAPLHDAIFAVASMEDEQQALADLRKCMERAASDLLGIAIPIEFFVTRYPDHFVPDDKPMAVVVWDKMMKALEKAEGEHKNGTTQL